MYSNKMALATKVDGKVLRENAEHVSLPFGSEYSILVKNLSTVRALIKITIDDMSISDDNEIIVDPNSSVDLERFIRNGNMLSGNKFKFIERTEKISNHRSNKIDDGLVRVEYRFEKIDYFNPRTFRQLRTKSIGDNVDSTNVMYCNNVSGNISGGVSDVSYSSYVIPQAQASLNDVGITVEGNISNQQFTIGKYFSTEAETHVMMLRLVGEVQGQKIKAPILTTTKPRCKTCDHLNKASSKFCTECGTSLIII